jgi:hypothetical protein
MTGFEAATSHQQTALNARCVCVQEFAAQQKAPAASASGPHCFQGSLWAKAVTRSDETFPIATSAQVRRQLYPATYVREVQYTRMHNLISSTAIHC